MAILAGLVAVALGIWGILRWFGDLVLVMKGLVPISLIFAGVVALIVGSSKTSPPSSKKDHDKS